MLARYERLLTQDERAQWLRFVFEKDRHTYLVSRALLRTVLGDALSIPPEEVRFAKSNKGKPFLDHPEAGPLSFNLSHCAGMAVLAVTRHGQVGIDVESTTRTAPLSIANHYFTVQETKALMDCAEASRNERFFDLWTLKESYIKATGQGLSTALDSFGFDLSQAGRIDLQGAPHWQDRADRWWLAQWHPSPTHVAALCVETLEGAASPAIECHRYIPLLGSERVELAFKRSSGRNPALQ